MATTVAAGFAKVESDLDLTTLQDADAAHVRDVMIAHFRDKFVMDAPAFAAGSYRRRSIVRDERDVDVMAPLSRANYASQYRDDSRRFLYRVRDSLAATYPSTKVSSKQVAVRVAFARVEADVVPCFIDGSGYLMPNGTGGWQRTNPPYHIEFMEAANKRHDWRLKPLIRIMKVWNIHNAKRVASFHLELMIESVWRYLDIPTPMATAVAATLEGVAQTVRKPFPDPWPLGVQVDAYLGYTARQAAIERLDGDAAHAREAERLRRGGYEQAAYNRWKTVFMDAWPAWG